MPNFSAKLGDAGLALKVISTGAAAFGAPTYF